MELKVQYARRSDGARTAMTVVGSGPVLVVPPSYISHLEWHQREPHVRAFYDRLAAHFTTILYDQHGVGLSDRNRTNFTIEDDLLDVEAVVSALRLTKFSLFGVSTGGMVALLYTGRHPDRVSRLVLYGTSAGFQRGEHPRFEAALAALGELIRANWALGSRTVAGAFFPSSTPADILDSFSRLQRIAATPEVAARIIEHLYDVDLRPVARALDLPVLILHRREDNVIPFAAGRELASLIRDSRFLPLDGDIHHPAYRDTDSVLGPAIAFLEEIRPFERQGQALPVVSETDSLSRRELEVLRLIASGRSNRQIAQRLTISIHTADRHVSNILGKLGAANRAEAASFAVRHGIAE